MSRTTKSDVYNPELLSDTIQGEFKQKNAFVGSALQRAGAVVINDSFSVSDPKLIGTKVTIPRFGVLGDFVDNPDGSALDFQSIGMDSEFATVGRDSLGFEVSTWAQFVNSLDPKADPYKECARQATLKATRAMDRVIITAAATTPLVLDLHSLTSPVTLDYALMADAKSEFWGDEQEDIIGAIVHSRTKADLMKLADANGNPLLVPRQNEGEVDRFCGVPLFTSDKAPLTGSVMSAVTAAGTTPPTVTLSGTPLGAWNLEIDVVTGGLSNGTATFRFRVKGTLWSKTYPIPSGGGAILLDDTKDAAVAPIDAVTAKDSRVGVNGLTGITATFANGTYNADNTYTSKARLKVATQLVKRGALAFWYNRRALAMVEDKDIARHTNLGALHLYRCGHLYERPEGHTMPGVVSVVHNVGGYL